MTVVATQGPPHVMATVYHPMAIDPQLGADGSHQLEDLARRPSPWFVSWRTTNLHRGLHVGAIDEGWVLTRPERSLMILGPPRGTGKTAAVLVPLVLSAFRPVVATSTKDDVFAATAMVRALQGRLWHFAPDGTEATPEGCKQLRWSPVTAAGDWDTAGDDR